VGSCCCSLLDVDVSSKLMLDEMLFVGVLAAIIAHLYIRMHRLHSTWHASRATVIVHTAGSIGCRAQNTASGDDCCSCQSSRRCCLTAVNASCCVVCGFIACTACIDWEVVGVLVAGCWFGLA
jgi:hypothetical protein